MASYTKLAYTTGTNVRIRSGVGTSTSIVTTLSASNTLVWTSGTSAGTANSYTWYAVSYFNDIEGTWYTGYMPSSYLSVKEATLGLSTNGYSSGESLTLSFSSSYSGIQYVTVTYTVTDSKGNSLYTGTGTSCTIALPSYYARGEQVAFTVTASYSHIYNWGGGAYFHVPSHSSSASITANWVGPEVTAPTITTLTHSGGMFSVAWSASTGTNGASGASVTYMLKYWDSESGESAAQTVNMNADKAASIARWIAPTWSDITYTFKVTALYDGVSASSSKTITLPAPSISWSNPQLTVTQVGKQISASWTAATINNNYESKSIVYTLTCGSMYDALYQGQGLSVKASPPVYDTALTFQVTATAEEVAGGKYSNSVVFTVHSPTVTAPGNPVITQNGGLINVSWTAATGSYGDSDDVVTYEVLFSDVAVFDVGTALSASRDFPSEYYGIEMAYAVRATYDQATATSGWTMFKAVKPKKTAVRCYIDGVWKPCYVYFYDTDLWRSCAVYTYDGEKWLSSS